MKTIDKYIFLLTNELSNSIYVMQSVYLKHCDLRTMVKNSYHHILGGGVLRIWGVFCAGFLCFVLIRKDLVIFIIFISCLGMELGPKLI